MDSQPITLMLQELAAGDKTAIDRLMPHVYSELRRLPPPRGEDRLRRVQKRFKIKSLRIFL